ncbi:unnamed protein product [Fraxinus pennsylvanica]|uniref:ZZ-type domain-containing protein n=1 Tax=Fraxinus pennsylvanica TaxID=56036 RepID=A0AAD2DQR2_9LAMI|nr:unnamed protein product [Fraxinus pennsylvanica]
MFGFYGLTNVAWLLGAFSLKVLFLPGLIILGTTGKREQVTKRSSLPRNAYLSWLSGHGPKFHPGVGCDWCGMYPIFGERYKCKDCVEKIGFDLCEGCYKSSSKLPGRFNQQHTPEHHTEEVVIVTNLSNDASQDEIDEAASLNLSPDALQDIGNAIASSVALNNPSEDQECTDSET